MQAFGSDRLRQDGERWLLSSRLEKGWTPRVEKTSTSAEFPGTAILCDDEYFEVVSVDAIPQGYRYVLEHWRDDRAMRVTARYDAESELAQIENRRSATDLQRKRRAINALGIFAGHLPADVQEKIGLEYGIFPHWLTLMSCAAIYALAAALVLVAADRMMSGDLPFQYVLVAAALLLETSLRFTVAFVSKSPMGSLIGLISYTIYAASRGTLVVSDLPKIQDAPPAIAHADALAMREIFVTLLPRADQERVASRFDYHYRKMSAKVAATILIFSGIGVITAAKEGHVAGALVASAVAAEQVYRFNAFRRGPAGSILGYLARPLVGKLL